MMKNLLLLILFTSVFTSKIKAQCDSIFVTEIEIPQVDSLHILVSINNTSSTHHIYLNLILTDDLSGQIIAESESGNLQLYPNQITTYEIDTTILFGEWQQYYDFADIPSVNNITVNLVGVCDTVPWNNSLSINEVNKSNTLILYPNPASNFLHVEGAIDSNYVILNTMGQELLRSYTTAGEINIEKLPQGIYFLKVEGYDVRQFIKD